MQNLNIDLFWASLADVFPTVGLIVAVVIALEALLYFVLKRVLNYRHALPLMLVIPAAVGLGILVVYPIGYNIGLAFSNLNLPRLPLFISAPLENLTGSTDMSSLLGIATGFSQMLGEISAIDPNMIPAFGADRFGQNILLIFSEPILKQASFLQIFLQTILWTVIQVTFHVVFGLILAMLLNRPMKLRGIYRTIILLPWAIPQVIAVLAWRSEFNYEFGFLNTFLRMLFGDGAAIQWMSDPVWNFVAMNIVNIWLGIPFMSVTLLGGLQSIDSSYYEAAGMDGASKWQQFKSITLPLIQPVMAPSIILGVIWTFNNFNVPFFINQNEYETSDILVTALFRAAFEYNRYGFAAALALVIFAILMIFTLIYFRAARVSLNLGQAKSAHRAVGE